MDKLTIEIAMKYMFARIYQYDIETGKKVSDYKNIQDLMLYHTNYHNIPELLGYDSLLAFCKLQLRKLESLTEEEKKYISDLYYFPDQKIYLQIPEIKIILNLNFKNIIDQLRKWNIDIDGLIESGVAEEVR